MSFSTEELNLWFSELCKIYETKNEPIEDRVLVFRRNQFLDNPQFQVPNPDIYNDLFTDVNVHQQINFYVPEIVAAYERGMNIDSTEWKAWHNEITEYFLVLFAVTWLDIPWNVRMSSGQCFDKENWQSKKRYHELVVQLAKEKIKEKKTQGF